MRSMLFAVAGLFALASTPAYALIARTWVSGKGVDQAGCGPIATPCRSLQFAHDQTNPGGEIDVLDSAGYGSLVINRAITIIGDGVIAGVLAQPGGTAININAGATDAVILRGLTVEGQATGQYGIRFNSGGSLTVANCLVQNFGGSSGVGIFLAPSTGTPTILISNTTTSYNAYVGIWFLPSGTGAAKLEIDKVIANNSPYGIAVNTGLSTAKTTAGITNSSAASNASVGVYAGGANTRLMVDRSVATGNYLGIQSQDPAIVYVGRSVITKNSAGLAGSGTIFTYGNNQIDFNTTDITVNTLSNATLR